MPDRLSGHSLVIATGHALSLALLAEDGGVLAAYRSPIQRGHDAALVPAIAALMAPFAGRPARILVETGPGSFTGLRIGLAAARALALAWGARLEGVRSTMLVAAEARARGHAGALDVALAAPRGQIWFEAFAAGGLDSLGPPVALLPERLAEARRGGTLVGTAPGAEPRLAPRAEAAARLGAADVGPPDLLYVRVDDADAPERGGRG